MSAKSVLHISVPSMALWPDVIDASPQWNRTGEPREHRRYVPERGECHYVRECKIGEYLFSSGFLKCDKCSYVWVGGNAPNYCPHCGKRVKTDREEA